MVKSVSANYSLPLLVYDWELKQRQFQTAASIYTLSPSTAHFPSPQFAYPAIAGNNIRFIGHNFSFIVPIIANLLNQL